MSLDQWCLSQPPVLFLFFLAYISRRQFGTWLVPSAFFSIYWGILLEVPLILAPDFYFWPGAAYLIFLFALCVHAGVCLGAGGSGEQRGPAYTVNLDDQRVMKQGKKLLVLCTLFGIFGVWLTLKDRGYSFATFLHPKELLQASVEFTTARYHNSYTAPFLARVFTSFIFLGSFISGAWYNSRTSFRSRLWCMLPFVPVMMTVVVQTTRSSLFICVGHFIGAYSCFTLLKNRKKKNLFRKVVIYSLCVCIVIIVVVGAASLRVRGSVKAGSHLIEKARYTMIGSPSAFSQWLEDGWQDSLKMSYGAYTLAGFTELVGISDRNSGLYTDQVSFDGGKSNVFTALRGLIEDFTLPGTVVLLFLCGVVFGYIYGSVLKGGTKYLFVLAFFYTFTMWSGVVSVLNYNSIAAAWILFFFLTTFFGSWFLPESSKRTVFQGG
jgi:oligosaccharide repeat unit polymerase